jgi:hypothetical protein
MAALVKKGLQVTATDADADMLATAAHCASVPANLHFTDEPGGEYDAVIDLGKMRV